MLYAAKCYWPGVTERELDRLSDRVSSRGAIVFVGSLLFPQDELVLCLFEAPSREAVKQSSEQAGMPCERVIESVWIDPNPKGGHERCNR